MQPDPSYYAAMPAQHAVGVRQQGVTISRQPLTLAFGIDNHFALPLAATLHSLLDGLSGDERPHIHIVSLESHGISPANKKRLHRVVGDRAALHWPTLSRLPVEGDVLATSENLSLATHYRVFLPAFLPPECTRVIYLDADVIVQGDLRALWETEMHGHVLMAVRDPAIFNVASPMGIVKYRELELPPQTPYFNGGVLLVDVGRWRQERMTEQFLAYSTKYGQYSQWGDQDGLNVIAYNRWELLDDRWNLQTFAVDGRALRIPPDQQRYVAALRARQDRLTAGSFIIHYTEGRKPWHPWCRHPFRALFHRHFRQSGCFRFGVSYGAWYALRYLAWFYKKMTTRRGWKKAYARLLRKRRG